MLAIAASVIAGWLLDVTWMRTLIPGSAAMKFQTAVALACIAGGLLHRRCGSVPAVLLPAAGALLGVVALPLRRYKPALWPAQANFRNIFCTSSMS